MKPKGPRNSNEGRSEQKPTTGEGRPFPDRGAPVRGATAPPAGDRPLKTLDRILSKAGIGSRTDARLWIAAGRVEVNGTAEQDPDRWVDLERDQVTFDGKPVARAAPLYLLLHKPAGYLTTYRDPQGRPTIYDLLGERQDYLVHVGRLDLETSGLLLLTNDTKFAERLTNPEYKVPKTYRVRASRLLVEGELDRLRDGLELKDGPTRPASVKRLQHPAPETVFEITITEGRNRQVRRMVEVLGAEVLELARIAIGELRIGELQAGSVRELTAEELSGLRGR